MIDELESLGRASAALRAARGDFPEEQLTQLVDLLIAAPDDAEAADALEKAIEDGRRSRRGRRGVRRGRQGPRRGRRTERSR